jgi:REP element-mobilizing transposase RayT
MVHKYQHFNPNTYRLDVKIAVVKSGFHCKCNINCHLVWIPKYRKIVLDGLVKETLNAVLDEQCKELELEIMPDHL